MNGTLMSSSSIIVAFKKFWQILVRKQRFVLLRMLLLAFVVAGLEIITANSIIVLARTLTSPEFGVIFVEKLGLESYFRGVNPLVLIALGVGLSFILKSILSGGEIFYQNFAIQRMSAEFTQRLLRKLSMLDYALHKARNTSLSLQLVTSDTERAFSGLASAVMLASEFVVFLSLSTLIIAVNPQAALFIGGFGLLLFGGMTQFVFPLFYKWGLAYQEVAALSAKHLIQFFHGIKEIMVSGKTDIFIERYAEQARKKMSVQAFQTSLNNLPRVIIETIFVSLFVGTIIYLCSIEGDSKEVLMVMSGYFYAGFRLMPGLNRIISQLNNLKSVIPSVDRIHKEYFQIPSAREAEHLTGLTFKNFIKFENVSYAYPDASVNSLENINLTINKGKSIGIVGETGSGKSTLVDLILGILKPTQGRVSVDEKYSADSHEWRAKIGYVPQSLYLVDDTIANNIAFGESHINMDRLNYAIEGAQLRKLVDSLPEGINSLVGDRGLLLSGGEKQRVAIARALYHDPEVIIFDEATSALDVRTEAKLMDTIYKVSESRTVIMIAHRVATLDKCDQIIELTGGKLLTIRERQRVKKIDGA